MHTLIVVVYLVFETDTSVVAVIMYIDSAGYIYIYTHTYIKSTYASYWSYMNCFLMKWGASVNQVSQRTLWYYRYYDNITTEIQLSLS